MSARVSVSIPGHGNFSTTADLLDLAIRYYSLATTTQLQALLTDIDEGETDYSGVSNRSMLLVIICDRQSTDGIHLFYRRPPNPHQARTIVAQAKRSALR